MRVRPALAVLLALLTGLAPAATARSTATDVRGGYVNELGFVPTSVAPTADPDVYRLSFTGGSIWDGDFVGHTVIQGVALMHVSTGVVGGSYTETFYGTFVPDHRTGSLTTRGHFTTTEQQTFLARARIVGGTCGFNGSSGSMRYDGASVHGGYVGSWRHPAATPPSTPCL
jgi:hypothetical protein